MNIVVQIIIGFLIADILTGAFHWFEDTYLDYCIDIPFISDISKHNELHHYFPRSIIAYTYLDNISVSLPLTIGIIFITLYLNRGLYKSYKYLIITFAIFCIISNIIHRFSHMRECENHYIINLLQQTGILCSHNHHSLHHTITNNEKYCVISEYNNFFLDSLQFWRVLEYIIYVFTGVKPNRKQSYDEYYSIHNHMHENAKLECPDKPTKEDVDELIHKLNIYKNCCSESLEQGK